MWLITPVGFFSVVQKPGDKLKGTLTLRSRVRGDLTALKQHYLPGLGPIQESHHTDYRFRAVAPRAEVSAAMARMVDGLDYSNFKSEVGKTQGHKRANLYHKVWDVLYHLQTDPEFVEKEPVAENYGGVVISGGRKVLLREPTKHYGGYAWTLAKTEAKAGESPRDAAVRTQRAKRPVTTQKSESAFGAPSKARLPLPATTSWMPSILQPSRTGRPPGCAG